MDEMIQDGRNTVKMRLAKELRELMTAWEGKISIPASKPHLEYLRRRINDVCDKLDLIEQVEKVERLSKEKIR